MQPALHSFAKGVLEALIRPGHKAVERNGNVTGDFAHSELLDAEQTAHDHIGHGRLQTPARFDRADASAVLRYAHSTCNPAASERSVACAPCSSH